MMDQVSQAQIVTRVLRTAGVLAVFVGCILVSHTVVGLIAAQSASSGLPPGMTVKLTGTLTNLHGWAIVSELTTAAWGIVLFALAKPIAARIIAD